MSAVQIAMQELVENSLNASETILVSALVSMSAEDAVLSALNCSSFRHWVSEIWLTSFLKF